MTVPVEVIENLRAALHSGLRGSAQIPPRYLDEIVDLAVHAAVSGINTTLRIALHTAPHGAVSITALGPALSLLLALAENQLAGLKRYAAENDMVSEQVRVQIWGAA